MGEVIRRSAAASDIFDDVRTTHRRAQSKGGKVAALADERLGGVVALIEAVEGREKSAAQVLLPLLDALETQNELADRLLGRISDEVWNDVGRPASDPALSILFPGGIAYYAEGDTEEQPQRMEVLAELFEAGVHPRIAKEKAAAHAAAIREGAAALEQAVAATRVPNARSKALSKVKVAVAKSAHVELAALKRRFKSEGMSEAEIHAIIPDRPVANPKKPAPVAG